MTDAININKRVLSNTPNQSNTVKSGGHSSQGSGKTEQPAGSTVSLTSSNILQELKQQIDSLPEVNSTKVDAIKQAITNGEYKPDPLVIAQKFIEIEKLLP